MSTWPTLSSTLKNFAQQPVDDTISSTSEAGYTQTRPRFTRERKIFGPLSMRLSRADRDTLVAFDETVKGSTIFTITHPDTGATLNVRFKSDGRVTIRTVEDSAPLSRLYDAEFTLEEA